MVCSLKDVKIAVIGGSGLYNLEGLEVIEEVNPETVSIYIKRKKKNSRRQKRLIELSSFSLGDLLVTKSLSLDFLAETRLLS